MFRDREEARKRDSGADQPGVSTTVTSFAASTLRSASSSARSRSDALIIDSLGPDSPQRVGACHDHPARLFAAGRSAEDAGTDPRCRRAFSRGDAIASSDVEGNDRNLRGVSSVSRHHRVGAGAARQAAASVSIWRLTRQHNSSRCCAGPPRSRYHPHRAGYTIATGGTNGKEARSARDARTWRARRVL